MTTINNLPEEILLIMLGYLDATDLVQFQKVRRAWYLPAHFQLLKEIQLHKTVDIQHFIAVIDHNPDPHYLKAVKSISINNKKEEEEETVQFDIEKLFLRFPNLQNVFVFKYAILFEDFNEQACKNFLEQCPKLERFQVVPERFCSLDDYEIFQKIRHLVTHIDEYELKALTTDDKTLVDLLVEFPRLQYLEISDFIENFQAALPAFDQLNIKLIDITYNLCDDQVEFAEKYLETKSKEQQDLIIQRLSNLKKLCWRFDDDLCVNAVKFIDMYLTGLDNLIISSFPTQTWSPLQQQVFCNNVLHSLCSAKHYSSIALDMMDTSLSACFRDIIHQVFDQAPSNHNKLLKIHLSERYSQRSVHMTIELDHSNFNRMIELSSKNKNYPYSMINQAKNFDEFMLDIPHDDLDMSPGTCYEMLKPMPLLKKITLDIPSTFKDCKVMSATCGNSHSLVKKLTLNVIKCDTQFQSLLDMFSVMFPNLTNLDIKRFCGFWKHDMQEYQIKLSKYSLEYLTIDATRLKIEMQKANVDNDFFVVDVDHGVKRFTFKVSIDLSSVSQVHQEDLKDYCCIHIFVKSLYRLELQMYSYDAEEHYLNNSSFKNRRRTFIKITDE